MDTGTRGGGGKVGWQPPLFREQVGRHTGFEAGEGDRQGAGRNMDEGAIHLLAEAMVAAVRREAEACGGGGGSGGGSGGTGGAFLGAGLGSWSRKFMERAAADVLSQSAPSLVRAVKGVVGQVPPGGCSPVPGGGDGEGEGNDVGDGVVSGAPVARAFMGMEHSNFCAGSSPGAWACPVVQFEPGTVDGIGCAPPGVQVPAPPPAPMPLARVGSKCSDELLGNEFGMCPLCVTPWHYRPVKNLHLEVPKHHKIKRAGVETCLYVWFLEFHEDRRWLTGEVWTVDDIRAEGTNKMQGGTRVPDRDSLRCLLRNPCAFDSVYAKCARDPPVDAHGYDVGALRAQCAENMGQSYVHVTCANDLQTLIKVAMKKHGFPVPSFRTNRDEILVGLVEAMGEGQARASWMATVGSGQEAVARFRDLLTACVLAAMDGKPVMHALVSGIYTSQRNPYMDPAYALPSNRLDVEHPRFQEAAALVEAANHDASRTQTCRLTTDTEGSLVVNPLEVYLFKRNGMKPDGTIRSTAAKQGRKGGERQKRGRKPRRRQEEGEEEEENGECGGEHERPWSCECEGECECENESAPRKRTRGWTHVDQSWVASQQEEGAVYGDISVYHDEGAGVDKEVEGETGPYVWEGYYGEGGGEGEGEGEGECAFVQSLDPLVDWLMPSVDTEDTSVDRVRLGTTEEYGWEDPNDGCCPLQSPHPAFGWVDTIESKEEEEGDEEEEEEEEEPIFVRGSLSVGQQEEEKGEGGKKEEEEEEEEEEEPVLVRGLPVVGRQTDEHEDEEEPEPVGPVCPLLYELGV